MAPPLSDKPREKKRLRLSIESNDGAVDSTEDSKTNGGTWDPFSLKQAPSSDEPTIDIDGNPMYSLCMTGGEAALAVIIPLRNVNWTQTPRSLIGSRTRLRAALAQRSGMEAPRGEECQRCVQGKGPFGSCVVHRGPGSRAVGNGACMCCLYHGIGRCSLRQTPRPNWYIQYFIWDINPLASVPFRSTVSALSNFPPTIKAPASVPQKSVTSSSSCSPSSGQSKKGGPSYSETWYQTPLDNAGLAKDHDGIVTVREDLRVIRARVEYDIKKLSKFAGDGGSEDEMLEDYETNPFYDSTPEIPDIASDDVDSVDVSILNLGSAASRPGVSRPDASRPAGSSSAASSSKNVSSEDGDAEDIVSSDHGAPTFGSDVGYVAAISDETDSDDVDE